MIKTLKNLFKQDKERYTVPRKVQDVIPVRRIWKDGIFLTGGKFAKTYKFTDINYLVASREDKESMFLTYSELLNSLDSGATTKITINNRRLNKANFEQSILMPLRGDFRDEYRREYNQMLLDKATGANGIVQEKYLTISVVKKDIEEARAYFARVGADLISHFSALGSKCTELDAEEKLRVLHDFYRQGEEAAFHFDPQDMMKKGHDFRDYICPDSIEKNSDYLKLGEKFCRVLFLKDYASYIKDSMVTELTDFNRNMMLSIDVVPVPTDEAVREVENRLLGVETNITNWQRRQNANNNFSAVIPYDMELQRKESKEFLDDLTTRDPRMMFGLITMVLCADSKEQLDSDTEAVLSVARKHMCQLATLKFQQLDGLNTVLPIGVRKINAFRTLTTESLAVFIPFKVQEIRDSGGIYYGENAISHNLIMCNKANLLNQSAFLLGVPGSGKSFCAKELTPTLILFCAWPLHRRHKPPVFQKGRSKQMSTTYLRGQLYYADLSKGVGSEQEGYRPVLIIQNDVGNKYSPTVIVAAVTSKVGVKPKLPTHCFIEANTVGLTAPSIVLLEQLRTLDKRRLERYIGRVDSCHIREINRALAVSVGLMEEMPENLIMCLCPTCANNFYGTGSYFLRRISADDSEKDICTYCGQRRGFDYEVVQRPKDNEKE